MYMCIHNICVYVYVYVHNSVLLGPIRSRPICSEALQIPMVIALRWHSGCIFDKMWMGF